GFEAFVLRFFGFVRHGLLARFVWTQALRSSRWQPPGPRESRRRSRASSSGAACGPASRRGGAWSVLLLLSQRQGADESPEARAVEEAHRRKIDEQVDVAFLEQARHRLLEGRL